MHYAAILTARVLPQVLITALAGAFLMPTVWICGKGEASKKRPQYDPEALSNTTMPKS